MTLTNQQYNGIEKASKVITLKKCEARIGFMMQSIVEPEVTKKVIKRGSIYLTLYAWVFYSICTDGTGLGKQDAANHFFALFIDDEDIQDENELTITLASLDEANKLKKNSPKLVNFLIETAINDFQGNHQEFHVTIKRAYDIETRELNQKQHQHTISCPFCEKNVNIPNIVEKTAFHCPHCNQVFNVQP
jgi:hypothetical protein